VGSLYEIEYTFLILGTKGEILSSSGVQNCVEKYTVTLTRFVFRRMCNRLQPTTTFLDALS